MKNEHFNPVKAWHKSMDRLIEQRTIEMLEEEAIRKSAAEKLVEELQNKKKEQALKRKEQARKTTIALLEKNPNHFKELAALAKARKNKIPGNNDDNK
jgi:hypothetical protein